MKRLLFVSDACSIHTRRWAECFRDEHYEVHIASFRDAHIPGVQVHLLPTAGLGRMGYLLAVPALRRLMRTLSPDIVHAQYVTSYGFVSALACMRPRVVTAWGTDVLISPRKSRLSRALARYALRNADVVTTVAAHMNPAVVELGVPPASVFAVPFGVDCSSFRSADVPPPAAPPLRLICTRNFAPVYAVDSLIDAVAELKVRGLEFQLQLVGAGPLEQELQAQISRLGLSNFVELCGHVDHATLSKLLGESHVFITPARSDGNNVSLNEAMACGCFPIATDIPANTQWLCDGDNGLLYPAGDAHALALCIERVAADPDWRARAALRNRQIVEERADWRVSVERMKSLYMRAITKYSAEG